MNLLTFLLIISIIFKLFVWSICDFIKTWSKVALHRNKLVNTCLFLILMSICHLQINKSNNNNYNDNSTDWW